MSLNECDGGSFVQVAPPRDVVLEPRYLYSRARGL